MTLGINRVRRVAALEGKALPSAGRWLRVVQMPGQTLADALAANDVQGGASDNLIVRVVI